MIPKGIEIRPELQAENDVWAFGFSDNVVVDQTALKLLGGELLDYVVKAGATLAPRFVVIDLRNVPAVSSTTPAVFRCLRERLQEVSWRLVLLVDPTVSTGLSTTNSDPFLGVIAGEAQLRELTRNGATTPPVPFEEEAVAFHEEDLAEMDANGVTLDEAIRVIERLHG